jgi:hypothetical protein
MNIAEMEQVLKEKGLLKAHVDGSIKRFVPGERVYKNEQWHNAIDVFGIYKSGDKFCFFITDCERGIPDYITIHTTEDEACDALLHFISLCEKIWQRYRGEIR